LRESTIARNYAEALFESGEKLGKTEVFADLIRGLAEAIEAETSVKIALESPRVPKTVKLEVLKKTFAAHAPDQFVRFLGAVIKRGRQNIFPAISTEYALLVDDKFNRVHAGVTLARKPDEKLRKEITEKLSSILGKEVIPHFWVNETILGGIHVRVGDLTMDGSIRRKLKTLRRKMLSA
jgi:F-type H+-transporting ATPase subunit delta